MTDIGPVQLLAIGYAPGATFEGAALRELERLEKSGIIRVLDLLFIMKEPSGDLLALDYQGEDLGAIVGALMGFEFAGEEERPAQPEPGLPSSEHTRGLSPEEIQQLGDLVPAGQAAVVVLLEHCWARDLKRAVRSAGGVPIAEGFLTPEAMTAVAAELEEMAAALDEVKIEALGGVS